MATEGKKITLKSSDGEEFEFEEGVAMESQTIRHMIEDDCTNNGIPFPNEFCRKHVEAIPKITTAVGTSEKKVIEEDLKAWDGEFFKVDQGTLFDLILMGQSHPTGLTPNLLKLFEPRLPLEFKPPPEKKKCPSYTGMAFT